MEYFTRYFICKKIRSAKIWILSWWVGTAKCTLVGPGMVASCCKPSSVAGVVCVNLGTGMVWLLQITRKGNCVKVPVLFFHSDTRQGHQNDWKRIQEESLAMGSARLLVQSLSMEILPFFNHNKIDSFSCAYSCLLVILSLWQFTRLENVLVFLLQK